MHPIIDHEKTRHEPQQRRLRRAGARSSTGRSMATDLEQPNFYIDSIRVKSDRIFGTRILTDIDAYQLFGIRKPPRAPSGSSAPTTSARAGRPAARRSPINAKRCSDVPGGTSGFIDIWGIDDHGLDNLGLVPPRFIPENTFEPERRISAVASWRSTAQLLPEKLPVDRRVRLHQRLQLPRTVLRARMGSAEGSDRPTWN